jgi:hypothetical protein
MPENPQPETAQLSQYGDIFFCGQRIWDKIHVLVDYDSQQSHGDGGMSFAQSKNQERRLLWKPVLIIALIITEFFTRIGIG